MDMNALSALIEVSELQSFSAAAERLHITQPAVSKRIAALESELGMPLFDRIGRNVILTEAGHRLATSAKRILLEVDDARRSVENLSGDISGQLKLGTSHHIGLHRLPPILKRYHQHYPDVHLEMVFLDSEAACRLVETGELELAIVTLPNPDSRLNLDKIWQDELLLVVDRKHPLAKQHTIDIAQVATLPAVLPGHGTYTREVIDTAFSRLGYTPNVHATTNYLETLRMMVSVGLGWSILPKSMIDNSLTAININGLTLSRDLGIVRHPQRTLSNAGKKMIELCHQL